MATDWYYPRSYTAVGVDWRASTSATSVTTNILVYRWDNTNVDNYGGTFSETLSPDTNGSGYWSGLTWGSGTGTRQVDSFATRVYTRTHSAYTVALTIDAKNYGSYSGGFQSIGNWGHTYYLTIPAKSSYTVSYDANGGTGAPSSQTKWYGETLTLSSTVPTRDGFTFKGWATSLGGSVAYAAGASYTSNAALTLYAVWEQWTYTVSYNANGGSGAPDNQTKYYTSNLTLSSTVPTRTNYVFLGWSTNSAATSATYAAGGTFSTNANTTLYAVWKLNAYSVTYNSNGGSGSVSSQTKIHDTALTLQSSGFSRTGFTLASWNTAANGSGTSYALGDSYTANAAVALYAQWSRNSYTLSYNANGGTNAPSSQSVAYQGSATLSSTKATRAKYTFAGWATSASGSVAYAAGSTYSNMPASNVTLYAAWTSAYSVPSISNVTAYRCDSDGTANDEGEYGYVSFKWATSSTKDSTGTNYPCKNGGAVCVLNGQTYADPEPDGTTFSGSYSHVFSGISIEQTYQGTIAVTDTSGVSTTYTITVAASRHWMDFSPEYGVATGGEVAPDTNKFLLGNDELEVTGKAQFDGDVDVSGSTTAKAVSATSITDSGALTVSGTTTLNGTTNAEALTATSITDTGNLTVSGTGTFGNRAATMNGLAFIGTNPITSTAQDTCAYWTSVGNCVCYFENKSATNGQPFTYGFLINLVRNTEIHQEFWEQPGFDSRSSQSCHWFRATNTNQAAMPAWSSGGLDAYPVGAVYISYVSTSPASLFGGSWTQITDRFLRMANDVNTGGADSVSHSHWQTIGRYGDEAAYILEGYANTASRVVGPVWTNMVKTSSMGVNGKITAREDATFNTTVNNMPAYQDLYAWRRTA